jgi:hypothetical protein
VQRELGTLPSQTGSASDTKEARMTDDKHRLEVPGTAANPDELQENTHDDRNRSPRRERGTPGVDTSEKLRDPDDRFVGGG